MGPDKMGGEGEGECTAVPQDLTPPGTKQSSGPGLATNLLCDFGQVICPLWVSGSLLVK